MISIMMVSITFGMSLVPNVNGDTQKEFFQDIIRNPTTDNAEAVFSNTIPDELEGVTGIAVKGVDKQTDSETLAEDTLFGIFDTVEEQIFGENMIRVAEKFGDRIFQLVTNVVSNAIEASLEVASS